MLGDAATTTYRQRICRYRLMLARNDGGADRRARRNVTNFDSVGSAAVHCDILLVICDARTVGDYRRITARTDNAQQVRASPVDRDVLLTGRRSSTVDYGRDCACSQILDYDAFATS